jgi:hypothetical protein
MSTEPASTSDEWRVEVELDDPGHGHTLAERLHAHDLDDEARERLSEQVIVTREGSRIFLYAGAEGEAREAERVMRELLAASEVTAALSVTRWHPVEEAWRDASLPLPRTPEERDAERERKVAAEAREAVEEGDFDWEVRVELESHRATAELAERLERQGLPVVRRWRYLRVGALTEEGARELSEEIVAEAPQGAEARVEPRLSEPTHPFIVFLESR